MSIKVMFADDHVLCREGIKQLLEFDGSIEVISEVNDGYQYVFLYSNKKCTDGNISSITDALDKYVFDKDKVDPSLMYMHKIEHSPGQQSSSWKTFSFTITLDLTLFEDDLYIRYGASGQGEDTWENKEIYVTITPNK